MPTLPQAPARASDSPASRLGKGGPIGALPQGYELNPLHLVGRSEVQSTPSAESWSQQNTKGNRRPDRQQGRRVATS